jgi:hypothetical protein
VDESWLQICCKFVANVLQLLATLVLEGLVLAALVLEALARATAALRQAHRIRTLLHDVRGLLTNKPNSARTLAECLAEE